MYLLIMEDGEIIKSNDLTKDDYDCCHDGYVDLIDISNPSRPKVYIDKGWKDL